MTSGGEGIKGEVNEGVNEGGIRGVKRGNECGWVNEVVNPRRCCCKCALEKTR